MILRIFVLACTVFAAPSFGMMTTNEFNDKFEDMCFQNEDTDPFRVNGQENPLSNTLENFIALAEKFEAANPTVDLKGELYYFIRNYIYENIRLTTTGVGQWQPEEAVLTEIQKTVDDEDNNRNGQLNSINDIFTDEEKCSLYFMISHSIVEKRKTPAEYRAYDFNSSNRVYNNDLNPDDYYPQEIGVVAIRGSHLAVSLSKVLVGMHVGLKNTRERDLTSFQQIESLPADLLPEDKMVDLLYTHTLADALVLGQWIHSTRKGYASNGEWASIPLGSRRIDGFCPMVYKQSTAQFAYSYSSVRGAADGLILGNIIKPLYEKKHDARLSEILRMYYSREGIAVEKQTEEISASSVSFCNRREVLTNLERKLDNQMLLYGFLIGKKTREVPNVIHTIKNEYLKEQNNIYNIDDAKLGEYCLTPPTLDRPEDLQKETFLDIFVVMDSRTSQDLFEQQQLIIGYLSNHMDLRYSGSRMTILVDQRINSGTGSSGRVELKPVVIDTSSSSCAACAVAQIGYQRSETERDQIIVAIDQLLSERKENETKQHGANGKVVVYFDYQNDAPQVGSNNRIQGRLEKALRDLHLRHLDTTLYAVGLDSDVLKKFARNDPSLLFLASDGTEEMVAEKLYQKIASAPGFLQYADCEDGKNEPSAIYENFVSPMTLQHWVMPAKYFYKSRNLKVTFESTNAIIRVCHSRATPKPENELKNCMNTTVANRMEFKLSNPCQSFTRDTCSPFYFSVIGIRNSKELTSDNGRPRDYCNDINDQWCNTLDSIKFKVSHEGVRCNGCLGLGAVPSVLIFALLLTYFLHKKL